MLVLSLIFCVLLQVNNAISAETGTLPGEISRQKCAAYAKYASKSTCPFSDITKLEPGNYFAEKHEFPHMVMVGFVDKDELGNEAEDYKNVMYSSTGSLISEQFVLFAAHWVGRPLLPKVVRLGLTNLSNTDNVQEIKVKRAVPHPEYNAVKKENDLALIELEEKVNINEFVRPACLHTERDVENDIVIAAGWGRDISSDTFGIDDKLQKVVVQIYDDAKCINYITKLVKSFKPETMICAGTPTVITQQPNTGGPLLKYHRGDENGFNCLYDIVGVSSFGRAVSTKDTPDVHTRVPAYIPWIEEIVWKNKL